MPTLRHRLENSALLARILAAGIGTYLGLCNRLIRWQVAGRDDLIADLAKGPVLLVCWHGRSLMAPFHWPVAHGPLTSLYAASPIGRVSGALQRRLGLQPMEMSPKVSNRVASRMILHRVKDGISIGMTGDGPIGPVGQVKDAPLDWARVTGMPVYGYAFGVTRGRRLNTWDQMLRPRLWGHGRIVFERWDHHIDRKASTAQIETARASLAAFLDQLTAQADAAP